MHTLDAVPDPEPSRAIETPPVPDSPVRFMLRPVASPLPLGFGGLAVATFLVSGLQLGWIPVSETTSVALILLAAVAPAQLLTSLLGFLTRDGVAATGMGTLAGTWGAMGLILLTSQPGSTGHAAGLLLVMAAALMLIPAVGAAMGKLVPAAVLTTTSLRFGLTGVWELTSSDAWKTSSAIVGLFLAALAFYAALAMGLEDIAKRVVLPIGRRGQGARAADGNLEHQVAGLPHEAGIRQQL